MEKESSLQFIRFTSGLWQSSKKGSAFFYLISLIANLIVFSLCSIANSFSGKDFMNAIVDKDSALFYLSTWKYLVSFLGSALAFSLIGYLSSQLSVIWRQWLTESLMQCYLRKPCFYKIHNSNIENIDQRISEDSAAFTKMTTVLLSQIVLAVVECVIFTIILLTVSKSLVFILLAYASTGAMISACIGKNLVQLNFNKEQFEANFRYSLVHVRNHTESIALYGGEKTELNTLCSLFNHIVDNAYSIFKVQLRLDLFSKSYCYMILVLPWFFLAPAYFNDKLSFGQMSQASGAFMSALAALSLITIQFRFLSEYAASIKRLNELIHILENQKEIHNDITIKQTDSLEVTSLSLKSPANQLLFKDISLAPFEFNKLLIQGPSGCGKTSLFRALGQLWTDGSGTISCPPLEEILFLSQKPYLPIGTLRYALTYPSIDSFSLSESELRDILRECHLVDLEKRIGGFNKEIDFYALLTPGEQQKLAFSRIFLKKPKHVFLDEATSSLDLLSEKLLYERLVESNISFTSISHRPSLLSFHERILSFDLNKGWELLPKVN